MEAMDYIFEACRVFSIGAFLIYGFLCLGGRSMVDEFERFGLARFRVLTASLEVLGAVGLLASYAIPVLAPIAAGGLALLMFLGVLTRIRVRDSLAVTLPALILLVMNAYIATVSARVIASLAV